MVKILYTNACLCFFLIPAMSSGLEFQMETSKKDFYQGENITVSFVLSGKTDSVDVEVAKFPEFRSFWSENTVLRQGAIPLFPFGNQRLLPPSSPFLPQLPFQELVRKFQAQRLNTERKGVVGAYLITAMIGRDDLKIEPMKIMARDPMNGLDEPLSLESKMPDLTIRRLPSPPSGMAELFRGAVGQFQLDLESPEIRYRPGEAGTLRLVLRGEGNFPEINEIPLVLPPGIKLLSSRSQMIQTGQESAKAFEYTLSFDSKEIRELGPFSVVFFNPQQNRFLSVSSNKINVVIAEPIEEPSFSGEFVEIPLEQTWHRAGPFFLSLGSLALQAVLLFLLTFHMVWIQIEKLKRKKHQSLEYIRRQKISNIKQILKNGEAERASRDLTVLLDELLEKDLSNEVFVSRSTKLQLLENRYGAEARKIIEKFMSERDCSRFSRDKPPLSSLEIHLQKLAPHLDRLCG